MNDDVISRQALCEYALNQKNKSVTPNDIMRFPSAQPEILACGEGELIAESDGDCISRQALMKEFSDFVRTSNNSDFARTPTWNDAVSLVGSMPSAQPPHSGRRIYQAGYEAGYEAARKETT